MIMKQLITQIQKEIFWNFVINKLQTRMIVRKTEFIFGKNHNYYQIGNAYLQYEMPK